MTYRGANTNEVRRLSGEIDEILQVIGDSERLLNQLVGELPGVWSGPDADRTIAALSDVHLPAAIAAKGRLEAAVVALRSNARDQDETSGRLT